MTEVHKLTLINFPRPIRFTSLSVKIEINTLFLLLYVMWNELELFTLF